MQTKRIFLGSFALGLAALFVVAGLHSAKAAYTRTPGQEADFKVSGSVAQATLIRADLTEVSAANSIFKVNIFGRSYDIDISRANLLRFDRTPASVSEFQVGGKVNVISTQDFSNPFILHASQVRIAAGGTSTGGLTCSPSQVTVQSGKAVTFTASGGTGTYSWDVGGGSPGTGTGVTFTTTFSVPGIRTVTVKSGTATATCIATLPQTGANSEFDVVKALNTYVTTGVTQQNDPAVKKFRWNKPDLSTWNTFGGSQNLPLLAEAAAGNYKFFVQLAQLSKQQGNFGREFGSFGYYFSMPIAAKVVALRDAKRAGDTSGAQLIAEDLRASWAIWSLVTVPGCRTSSTGNFSGAVITGSNLCSKFSGAVTAVAGERWTIHYPPAVLGGDDVSQLMAWALDMPRKGSSSDLRKGSPWWHSIIANVMGQGNFASATDADKWGLTTSERQTLRSITQGDTSGLDEALSMIRTGGGLRSSYTVRMRRTSEGVETVFFKSNNGNKPAQAMTKVTNGGVWTGMAPCRGAGGGANKDMNTWIEGGAVYSTGEVARCTQVSMPELGGSLLYSVVMKGGSVAEGNVTSVTPSEASQTAPAPGGDPYGQDVDGGVGGPGGDAAIQYP